jgi:hypothetical protein
VVVGAPPLPLVVPLVVPVVDDVVPDVPVVPLVVPLLVVPLLVVPLLVVPLLVPVPVVALVPVAPPAPEDVRLPLPSSEPMAQEKSVRPAANSNAINDADADKEFFRLMVVGLPRRTTN